MSDCKQVNSDLARVEFISLRLEDAEVEKDELDAAMGKKNTFKISERVVYIVHSRNLKLSETQ
jgi:hypothetical protein